MDIAEAVALARTQHHLVLSTRRADGTPQMSPVVQAVDDDGRLMVSTRDVLAKTHNIRRDPRVSACVLPDGFFGAWAQIDGTAEVIDLPDAMPLLEAIYRQVSGEHPDWNEFRQAMVDQRRVVLRITPTAPGDTRGG